MKQQVLIATENEGKMKEIREIFKDTPFEVHFLSEFRDRMADVRIVEGAKSFEGNALIKAILVGEKIGMLTLADDSGLSIEALDGRPGVYSARYSEVGTDAANNEKVLLEMKDVPEEKRNCHYNCTVAIYDPETNFVETVAGEWHGRIAKEPRGEKSFGYAPIFLSENTNFQKTNAEMEPEELIGINHRGKAFEAAIKVLKKYYRIT